MWLAQNANLLCSGVYEVVFLEFLSLLVPSDTDGLCVKWSSPDCLQRNQTILYAPTSGSATSTIKKVATHSHIRGLGLKEDGYAESAASGFVGQCKGREVFGKPSRISFYSICRPWG